MMEFDGLSEGYLRDQGVRRGGASVVTYSRSLGDRLFFIAFSCMACLTFVGWAKAASDPRGTAPSRLAGALLSCITGGAAALGFRYAFGTHEVTLDTKAKTYKVRTGFLLRRRFGGNLSEIECLGIVASKGGRGGVVHRVYLYWEDPSRPRVFLTKGDYFIARALVREVAAEAGLPVLPAD